MTAATGDAIVVRDMTKRYGKVTAVAGLNLRVHFGEVFALLGPNGAGKTTTVEILEGFRHRTSGDVSVLGFDPGDAGREYREHVGIVLQSAGFDANLSVRETVKVYAALYCDPRPVADVLDLVGLLEVSRKRVGALSGGQQRRVDLALALVGNPELIFLDEPTTGFDPVARRRSWDIVKELKAEGKTVLLTSHYLDEVQQLADRIAIINTGRVVAEATPRGMRASHEGATITFELPPGVDPAELPDGPWTLSVRHDLDVVMLTTEPTQALHIVTAWALERGLELPHLEVIRPSLEEAYLRLTAEHADG